MQAKLDWEKLVTGMSSSKSSDGSWWESKKLMIIGMGFIGFIWYTGMNTFFSKNMVPAIPYEAYARLMDFLMVAFMFLSGHDAAVSTVSDISKAKVATAVEKIENAPPPILPEEPLQPSPKKKKEPQTEG
jgi:hypothetical protein